jgi:hypothetical protein
MRRPPQRWAVFSFQSRYSIGRDRNIKVPYLSNSNHQVLAMHLWTSLTSHLGRNSKPTTATPNNKMNNSEYQLNEARVRIERTPTIPISPSNKQTPTQLPYRPIDPSQTLQLPFHESQKAETPFVNPLGGEFPVLVTPPRSPTSPYAKLPSSERTSPSFTEAAARPRCDGEEKGTWQDGWVKVVEIDQEGERGEKKRSKKEWRNEEVEPAKKKSRDHNRITWVPRQRKEKVASHWGPNVGLRRGYT